LRQKDLRQVENSDQEKQAAEQHKGGNCFITKSKTGTEFETNLHLDQAHKVIWTGSFGAAFLYAMIFNPIIFI
jgi:hypothetical protein